MTSQPRPPETKRRWPRTIGEVMTRNPIAIRPDKPLAAARSIMESLGLRQLLVMDERRVVGLLRLADCSNVGALAGLDLSRASVDDTTAVRPPVVRPDESLSGVLEAMLDLHIDAVLVADGDRLLGVFTAVDAVALLGRLLRESEAQET